MLTGLRAAGLPEAAVQIAPSTDRAYVAAMLGAAGLIDLIIPRGGRTLVERVQAEARVPVLAHAEGLCHTYVHAAADPDMARRVVANAKMRRPGICGATETMLIDAAVAPTLLPSIVADLAALGCAFRADARARGIVPDLPAAEPDDFDTEWLDAVLSVKVVDGLDDALDHIARHGSEHTDAIVTEDPSAAEAFLRRIDSAVGMWNASTQFCDGGEFGFGGEIGIATGRIHARGPVGPEQLTTFRVSRHRHGTDTALKRAPQDVPLPCPIPLHGDNRRSRIGILGGSFNPAHRGHRHIAEQMLKRLRLDQVWLMVSPGNPLKPTRGMGGLANRLASARAIADGRRIVATAIEARLGTRYTVDTLRELRRRFPRAHFVWLMGADNLTDLPRWRGWLQIARNMPVAVHPRPGYNFSALAGQAANRLRHARRCAEAAAALAIARPPAWTFLPAAQHPGSATALRAAAQRDKDGD